MSGRRKRTTVAEVDQARTYQEWVALARGAPDHLQDYVWVAHERYARDNYRADQPEWVDLGGES